MNCEEAIKLVGGYLDGELDAMTSEQIELHLDGCSQCREAYEADRNLARAIRSAPYYKSPVELSRQIQSSLRAEVNGRARQKLSSHRRALYSAKESTRRLVIFGPDWSWMALAAALAVAALITFTLVPRSHQRSGEQFLATQLIASHVRSLMANHLTDVVSSDQHTVKPWLDAKLDFAPAVFDLSNDGFPLIGGRLDYLENRPVAALVYQRRKHFINLFIWPAESVMTTADKTMSRQGYQLVHWIDGDFNYWAVSDVSEGDLEAFRQAFEKQLPRR